MAAIGTTLLQCLLGIRCQNFTMLSADQMGTQSIVIMNDDEDKLYEMSDSLVLGLNGGAGDSLQFAQFVKRNLHLYGMRNGYALDTAAVVHFTRKILADALKTGNPNVVNILLAGYDEKEGGQLHTLDFLAASVKVPYAAHGYGGLFALTVMDRYYKPNLSESEAYELLKRCVQEIHQRLFLNLSNFKVKVVSASGVRELPSIVQTTCISTK